VRVCVSEESLCGSRDLICLPQNLVFVGLDVVTRGFSFSSGREYSGLVKDGRTRLDSGLVWSGQGLGQGAFRRVEKQQQQAT